MDILYRLPTAHDDTAIGAVARAAFDAFIADGLEEEGQEEFLAYIHPTSIRSRRDARSRPHFQVIAVDAADGAVLGIAEIRSLEHLSMLFVHPEHHRRGIAIALLRRVLQQVEIHNPRQPQITVYSSLYAVPIYERLGFDQTGPATTTRGIAHVPMELHRDASKRGPTH